MILNTNDNEVRNRSKGAPITRELFFLPCLEASLSNGVLGKEA